MLQTIKPTDLTVEVNLYDDNDVQIDESTVQGLSFEVYTPQTPAGKRIAVGGERYSNGQLFIMEKELRKLASGELFLTTKVSIVNEAYDDGTYDDERTNSLGLYLDNIYDEDHDVADIDELAEKVERNTNDISDIKADQIAQTKRIDGLERSEADTDARITAAQSTADNALSAARTAQDSVDAIDLTPYARKSELPRSVSELSNDAGYLTAVPQGYVRTSDLAPYAQKSEIPSLVSYATKAYVDEQVTNAVSSGTIDLSGYARRAEVPTRVSDLINDANYITPSSLSVYATTAYVDQQIAGVSGNGTIDLSTYAKKTDLTLYALKDEIPSVANFATKAYADNAASAAVSNLDLTSYATKQYVTNAVANAGGGNVDLSAYAKKTDISDFITLADLPDLSGYATKTYVQSEIAKIETGDVSIDLSAYAKKSEIPTVPTKTSELTNDSGFLTSHQSLAGYVTEGSLTNTLAQYQLAGNYATQQYVDQKVAEAASGGQIEIDQYDDTSVRQLISANTTRINDVSTSLAQVRQTIGGYDFTVYALKTQIPTVPANVSAFTNDAGYISEIPSSYAKKSDIPTALSQLSNDTNFLTAVPNRYATKDYVTESISTYMPDMSTYAKKTDLPTKTSELSNDSGFLTSIPSDYVKKTYVDEKVAENVPNLSAYATKSELPTRTSQLANDSGFITQSAVTQAFSQINLNDYALRTELPNMQPYATKTFVEEAISDVDHTPYALKSEIPSLTGYATQQYVDNAIASAEARQVDLSNYVTFTALDSSLSSSLGNYYTKAQVNSLIADISTGGGTIDSSNYYTKGEIISGFYSKTQVDQMFAAAASGGQIDLTGYATKDDLNLYATRLSLNDYATKLYVDTAVQDVISGDIDLTGYVKFGDLTNYVTQQELTNAIAGIETGDASIDLSGYATKAQLDASYYTKAQVDEKTDFSLYLRKADAPKAQTSAGGDANSFAYSTGAPSDQHSIVNRFGFIKDASTVSMTYGNWGSLLSQLSLPLPVADSSNAGVMTADMVRLILLMSENISQMSQQMFKWQTMSKAAYDALETKDPTTFYFITQ